MTSLPQIATSSKTSQPANSSSFSMRLSAFVLGAFALRAACSAAQSPPSLIASSPAFEVATIRPSASERPGVDFQLTTMRFRAVNATVTDLIRFAYDLRSDQLLQQAPGWAGTERFDVDGKIDDAQADATRKLTSTQQMSQYRAMLQSLLKDRFDLKVEEVAKVLSVYALEVEPNGPHMASSSAPPGSFPSIGGFSRGDVEARGVSMSVLSEMLSGNQEIGGRVVIDATGLKGSFDFKLRWTPFSAESSSDAATVPLATALKEQLGLKLTARKAAVQVLAISHVEHPSPN